MRSKVEVWDETAGRFFLVDQQVVEMPFNYTAQQTLSLPSQLSVLTRFLDDQHIDSDARWAFFRKAALRQLQGSPKDKRLGLFMERLGDLLERAQQDHSLYLERFSLEDLIKNFDEKRLKFVGDLNQILASIQTALIGVPLGFFVIAQQFKAANRLTGQNLILAGGAILFFALLFVLSLNQGKALEGISVALAEFEAEQKKRVTDKLEGLQRLLRTTWNQFAWVKGLLIAVRILLMLFSAVVVLTLIWCSIPSLQRAIPY